METSNKNFYVNKVIILANDTARLSKQFQKRDLNDAETSCFKIAPISYGFLISLKARMRPLENTIKFRERRSSAKSMYKK